MKHLLRLVIVCSMLLAMQAAASTTIYKVLEQSDDGVTSHRAFDRSSIGDGIDPVMQFIMLDSPTDPSTAQLLWVASETPIPWDRTADVQSYRMIEYADLPEDSRLEYRIYTHQTGAELTSRRHVRSVNDGNYAVDASIINALPDAVYDLHVHLTTPDRPTQILKQIIDVSGMPTVPIVDEEPGLENEEDIAATLEPGNGWSGETTTPGQIGNRHERAIAHWNVVPEQTVADGFTVGVVAHHLDGIDRVEVAANGGEWVKATLGINPRTGCEEYFAALKVTADIINLRAIAYPKVGQPFVVLPYYAGTQDLRLYASTRGSIIELPAGRHELSPRELPRDGWLTVRPKPGVAREDCVIVGKSRYWKGGNLKIQGVTWETPSGGGMCVGDPNNGDLKRVWFDGCDIKGRPETWWLASEFSQSFYTDTKITNTQNVWNKTGQILVRNVHVGRVYEDVIRSAGGLYVNLKVDRIDRGPYTTYHSDFLQAQWAGNLILQDVDVPSNEGQGIFPETLVDAAFVRVNIKSTSHGKALQLMGTTHNTLFKDSVFDGGAALRDDKSFNVPNGERLIFDDVSAGRYPPYLPSGWDLPNVYIYPTPPLYD